MRKRTVNHLADTIFWYILYFLPVICYLLFMFNHSGSISTVSPIGFTQYLNDIGFTMASDNLLIFTMRGLFGSSGVLPLFNTDVPFIILAWFVGVYLLHLAIDILIFIPRMCHKWLNMFCKE